MKRALAALVAFGVSLGAAAQEGKKEGDKIGKDKAPIVAKKALAETQKRKGAAIAEVSQFANGLGQPMTTNFEGVLRKDFAAVKGSAEVYAKGSSYLANTGARFDPPEDLQGQDAVQAQSFKNPALILKDLEQILGSASFGGDEALNGKECRVVDLLASEMLVKQHLKEIGERLNRAFKGFGGGFGQVINFVNVLDEKNTIATYRVSVGKDDLLIYRVEFVIKPQVKPGSLPPQVPKLNLDVKTDVKFSKWDEDVPFDIAGTIKAKWGIK